MLASYLILEFEPDGYSSTIARVNYDREAEVAVAEMTQMPFVREYVHELRTGRYQKRRTRL
jgi:protein phosphatase